MPMTHAPFISIHTEFLVAGQRRWERRMSAGSRGTVAALGCLVIDR
jgi:hypothetical protein